MCVFLGYISIYKGYNCLAVSIRRVYISRDVIFDESLFPFATSSIYTTPFSTSNIVSFPQSEPTIVNDYVRNYDLSILWSTNYNVVAAPLAHIQSFHTTTN